MIFTNYVLFLQVFARMSGMILFNPLLGKQNVPVIVRVGLSLFISMITVPLITAPVGNSISGVIIFILTILKELFVGFTVSMVFHMFISFILISGEIIDLQLGMGMSKIYDPQTNIHMPISGTVFHIMFILIFFSSGSHFTFIRLAIRSCEIFPPGSSNFINTDSLSNIPLLFGDILILALKLALPVIAIEVLSEAGLGIIMKTVPQINVFVVGLPLKLIIGLFLVILVLPSASRLIDIGSDLMFDNMEKTIQGLLSD